MTHIYHSKVAKNVHIAPDKLMFKIFEKHLLCVFPCLHLSTQRESGYFGGQEFTLPSQSESHTEQDVGSEVIHTFVQACCQTPQNCRAGECLQLSVSI